MLPPLVRFLPPGCSYQKNICCSTMDTSCTEQNNNQESMMEKRIALLALVSSLFAGCATVPMDSGGDANALKALAPPSEGTAGLYIFRTSGPGAALKKDVWIDGKCVGETAQNVFFYEEIKGGVEHKISTESEFSPNDLALMTESGKHYFVQQYIKFGVFVGGAGLKVVDAEQGKKSLQKLGLAKKGTCSAQVKG